MADFRIIFALCTPARLGNLAYQGVKVSIYFCISPQIVQFLTDYFENVLQFTTIQTLGGVSCLASNILKQ